ncbi:hypothetical protein [Rhodovulum strictum]|uniref:Uncharacterized protein n=1 Tax=Rhodovulum strictum TaxID=58314 RepID=A0A844B732_9RHOB|nr:hypothetical protein [Rhodovulum strictum]MRH21460.1 hypothetical protein [Rhodovulum strictum]
MPGRQKAPGRLILTPALRVSDPVQEAPQSVPLFEAPTPADPAVAPADGASLEQRIAELEAAFAGCDDEWEPDGTESLAAAKGWVSSAPATARPDPLPKAPGEGSNAAAPVLDEDALRDLVAEIVRQELQGRLGERITQNVRKLVHREINRALAMRDVE